MTALSLDGSTCLSLHEFRKGGVISWCIHQILQKDVVCCAMYPCQIMQDVHPWQVPNVTTCQFSHITTNLKSSSHDFEAETSRHHSAVQKKSVATPGTGDQRICRQIPCLAARNEPVQSAVFDRFETYMCSKITRYNKWHSICLFETTTGWHGCYTSHCRSDSGTFHILLPSNEPSRLGTSFGQLIPTSNRDAWDKRCSSWWKITA